MLQEVKNRLLTKWFVCRITSGRKSAQYGIRFSYPLYIFLVSLGLFLLNPYILLLTTLVALLGVMLPMHPFDYIYNFVITKFSKNRRIPGRGSELQINSVVAFMFNLIVVSLIIYGINLNYYVMAFIYIIFSIFFIVIHFLTDEFSIYSLLKRGK